MAVVFQGAILLLILGLIPIFTANDFSSFNSLDGSVWQNAGAIIKNVIEYVGLICKYVVIIILLIGSQRKAKQLMGRCKMAMQSEFQRDISQMEKNYLVFRVGNLKRAFY